MSPLTAFLQSLHSALIDELTERHPEPKPELGMPIRFSSLKAPQSDLNSYLAVEGLLGETKAHAFLSCNDCFEKAVGVSLEALWTALLKRAGAEFMRRQIQPRLSTPRLSTSVPENKSITKAIWIPFKLGAASGFLGMGTE